MLASTIGPLQTAGPRTWEWGRDLAEPGVLLPESAQSCAMCPLSVVLAHRHLRMQLRLALLRL
jgi:hypothetical protein